MTLPKPASATALLMLADGSVFWGRGIGAEGVTGGEVCFNTSMTGYQEIMTDPSYAGQIITFTFPHIGNIGANKADIESAKVFSKGLILRTDITSPSNHRSEVHFNDWLKQNNITGICGIDTRALTHHLRTHGAQNGAISFQKENNTQTLKYHLHTLPKMNGLDLAQQVTTKEVYRIGEKGTHIVVIDYGIKQSILNCLVAQGFRLTVVPCTTSADDILKLQPEGIFLSNGPGDPAATGIYAVPVIQRILQTGLPIFGICLGHQLLSLALGGKTEKLRFGHRGANHPVKDLETGKVEITSQNHGFHVILSSLPENTEATHISLFDGTNEGLRLKGRPVFSVQYHPEASPGPHDSHYLFERFRHAIEESRRKTA